MVSDIRSDWSDRRRTNSSSFLFNLQTDEDPRRMYRLIHFLCSLITNPVISSTFNEVARWSLIQVLKECQWRIPSVWSSLHEQAKGIMDHSSKLVRENTATWDQAEHSPVLINAVVQFSVLALSLSFNLKLFNDESSRQSELNQCIEGMSKKLRQAIVTYEETPLSKSERLFTDVNFRTIVQYFQWMGMIRLLNQIVMHANRWI